jgi:hypothetical protein
MVIGAALAAIVLRVSGYSIAASVAVAVLLFAFTVLNYVSAAKGIVVLAPSESAGRREKRLAALIGWTSLGLLAAVLVALRP